MKVTVAIPCYNAERWLRQCIESALNLRGVEPEIIVVDDGSTDRSQEIAKSFGSQIQRLVGGHKGANAARNLALQAASAEWIQFLDADDYLEPDKVRAQLEETNFGRGTDILYSPVWVETVTANGSSREVGQSSPDDDIDTQWIRWHIPQTGGALWRREPLLKLGGWKKEQPCCQEHELYLRARKAGLAFAFAPTAGAIYRIWSEDTLCRKDPILVTRVRTELMDSMWSWLESTNRATEGHRKEIGQACFEMARTWARFDLSGATAYHAERKTKGLIHLAGPAAPNIYRVFYKTLGFSLAERVAKAMR